MARNDDAAKEWGNLEARALIHSDIYYKPKINSSTVQKESTGAGAQQDSVTAKGSVVVVGEVQGGGGSECTVNRANVLARSPVQVELPAESRADVSSHGF